MRIDSDLRAELTHLIVQALDGNLGEQHRLRLNELLRSRTGAAAYYVHLIRHLVAMRQLRSVVNQLNGQEEMDNSVLLEAIDKDLENSKILQAINEAQEEEPVARKPVVRAAGPKQFTRGDFLKGLAKVAAVLTLAVGLIALDRLLWQNADRNRPVVEPVAPSRVVAQLTDVWGDLTYTESGQRLRLGSEVCDQTLYLSDDGYAELTFANRAVILLEGPALFTPLTGEMMFLQEGSLFAKVPQEAVGFIVDSPSMKIIDLGTEFGMQVRSNGSGDVHTYRGKVSLISQLDDRSVDNCILTAGHARHVENLTGDTHVIDFRKDAFVREIDSSRQFVWRGQPLDLADIVGWGNGFGTGRENSGINLLNGRQMSRVTKERHYLGKRGFVPVDWNPFVDGVFIPVGGDEPVLISSEGNVFDGCPATAGEWYFPVANSRYIEDLSFVSPAFSAQRLTCLTDPHDIAESTGICMHANAGVTFDLEAMRRAFPLLSLERFTCMVGMTTFVKKDETCGFFVLIDGEVRFGWDSIVTGDPQRVDIALDDEDRFLTLVCTEGAINHGDWGVFENAHIQVVLRETGARQ